MTVLFENLKLLKLFCFLHVLFSEGAIPPLLGCPLTLDMFAHSVLKARFEDALAAAPCSEHSGYLAGSEHAQQWGRWIIKHVDFLQTGTVTA